MKDRAADTYDMYWQVDGGQLNPMQTNSQDDPHKESQVDLSSWNWNASGKYSITFVAVDPQGQTVGQRTLTIQKDGVTPVVAQAPSSSSSSSQSSISSFSSSLISSSINQTASVASVNSQSTSSAVSVASSTPVAQQRKLNIWWPINGVTVQGSQPLKAQLENTDMQAYNVTWDVDGGQLNPMVSNYKDAPHKEAQVDVSGWKWHGSGPYVLTFRATDANKHLIATQSVTIYNGSPDQIGVPVSSVQSTLSNSTSSNSSQIVVNLGPTNNLFAGAKLYVNQNSDAKHQADAWRQSRPADAVQLDKIAAQPETWWFGNWNSNLSGDVSNAINTAKNQNALPVFVAYNIPQRDCGGYSSGGSSDSDAYRTWIRTLASGIGNNKAVVILEPDALAGMTCLSQGDQDTRVSLLKEAVQTLKSQGNVAVYLDAGHPGWIDSADMASRLKRAGIDQADGFALNVSNFSTDDANKSYGEAISRNVNGKHFIVDTGRNGLGPAGNNEWCNPWGRALGRKPTTDTGNGLIDAYLWVKGPGGSDGQCNGGPAAGIWWGDYALGLAQKAAW